MGGDPGVDAPGRGGRDAGSPSVPGAPRRARRGGRGAFPLAHRGRRQTSLMSSAPVQAGGPQLVRTLVDASGSVISGVARQDVENRLGSGGFFWLDLPSVGDEELSWLRELFHFHPLAIEDAEHFRQRPKLDEYDGYVVLILYGSGAQASSNEGPVDSPA